MSPQRIDARRARQPRLWEFAGQLAPSYYGHRARDVEARMPWANRERREPRPRCRTGPDLEEIVQPRRDTLAARAAVVRHSSIAARTTSLYREAVERLRALGTGELLADSLAEPPTDIEDWSADEDRAGEVLGVYRLVRRLGMGGMGAVYLAERNDQQFSQSVAIKLVRGGSRHARMCAAGSSPSARFSQRSIIRTSRGCSTAARPRRHPYLVMEYVDGRADRRVLRQQAARPHRRDCNSFARSVRPCTPRIRTSSCIGT